MIAVFHDGKLQFCVGIADNDKDAVASCLLHLARALTALTGERDFDTLARMARAAGLQTSGLRQKEYYRIDL